MVRTVASTLALFCLATLLASARGPQLNAGYLLPGQSVQIDRSAIAASRFCALTFDDGPDGTYTPQVAAILERYGVNATFFVVGRRAAGRPDEVRALSRAGHEIANHSWSHPDFTKLTAPERKREIERTQELLEGLGVSPRWFRPPFGAFDRSVVRSCEGCGLKPVLWSVDPRDWANPGADAIATRVLAGSGNGAVILLHSTNAQTVEALPRIIETLRERGFTFLTMTQWEAAAQGRSIPASGSGTPPSLRQSAPWLPEAPEPPGGGPGLLASAEPRVEANAADPEWVEQMDAEFYQPVLIGKLPSDLTVGIAPAQPSPAMSMAIADPPTAQHSDQDFLGDEGTVEEERAGAAPPPEATPARVQLGPPLFVHGNFDRTEQAQWVLDHERGGKLRRTP